MKIWNSLRNFKSRLTSVGKNEPLHFLSLMVIIALDIFVLVNVFQGLYLQEKQLDRPNEVIPYECMNYLLNNNNVEILKKSKLSSIERAAKSSQYFNHVQNKYDSGVRIIENRNKAKVYEKCHEIYNAALKLNDTSTKNISYLHSLIEEKEQYRYDIRHMENQNRDFRKNYDTQLLEDIAQQNEEYSITDGNSKNTKKRIISNQEKISLLENQIKTMENSIISNPASQIFLNVITKNQEAIKAKKSTLEFWYPLKKIGVQMLFILPLFFFFLWMYRRMLAKDNSLISLIFSHLLLVSMIPIFVKVFELLIEILPFHFFADFLALLEALNLVTLWNYILIIIGILATLGIIYFLQKKVFSSQKIWEKRISKKYCWNCGRQKPTESEAFCSFCGVAQLEKCEFCHKNKFVKSKFCKECGKK